MTHTDAPDTIILPTHDDWIQVHSRTPFDLRHPTPEQVRMQDIVVALCRQPRFGGHTKRLYTVAQHSLGVLTLLEYACEPEWVQLQGLLHDATEAYVVDVPRPLKRMLGEYKDIEERVWRAIARQFGVPVELNPAVKAADEALLYFEAHHLLPDGALWTPPRPLVPFDYVPAFVTETFSEGTLRQVFRSILQRLAPQVPW